MSRLAVHREPGQGSAVMRSPEPAMIRPAASAFSARPKSRGERMPNAATFIARSWPLGFPPRSESICLARRCTRIDGMSMRTGQASKQAPHNDDANGSDANGKEKECQSKQPLPRM